MQAEGLTVDFGVGMSITDQQLDNFRRQLEEQNKMNDMDNFNAELIQMLEKAYAYAEGAHHLADDDDAANGFHTLRHKLDEIINWVKING